MDQQRQGMGSSTGMGMGMGMGMSIGGMSSMSGQRPPALPQQPALPNLSQNSPNPNQAQSQIQNQNQNQRQFNQHQQQNQQNQPPPVAHQSQMDVFSPDLYSLAFTMPRNAGAAAFDTPSLMVGADGGVVVVNNQENSNNQTNNLNHPQPQPPGSFSAPSLPFPNPEQPSTSNNQTVTSNPTPTPTPAPTSRMGSMRSRFPPSVKAFMPSAFGGSKRTSERIAEVVQPPVPTPTPTPPPPSSIVGNKHQDEKTDGKSQGQVAPALGSETSAVASGGAMKEEKKVKQEGADHSSAATQESDPIAMQIKPYAIRQVQDRDSRSTVGTRSSLDFSTTESAVAPSTAPSTSGAFGKDHSRSQSYNSSHSLSYMRNNEAGHSASSSLSGAVAGGNQSNPSSQRHSASSSSSHPVPGAVGVGGSGHSRSKASADLDNAINRLVNETMSSHQCLVSFTQIQASEAQASAALNQAFPRQISYAPSPSPSPQIGQHTPLPFPSASPQIGGNNPLHHQASSSVSSSKASHPFISSDPPAPGVTGIRSNNASIVGSIPAGQQVHGTQSRRGHDVRHVGPGGPDALPPMLGFGGAGSHMDINTSSISLPLHLSGNHPSQTYNSFLHSSSSSRTPHDPSTPASMTSSLPQIGGGSTNAGAGQGSTSGSSPSVPRTAQFNFYLSGGAAQVMAARGTILRDNPFKARASVKVPRADILLDASQPPNFSPVIGTGHDLSSSPSIGSVGRHGSSSPPDSTTGLSSPLSSSESLKPEVKRKLDDLANLTKTSIAMIGIENRGQDLGYGLESERQVELVISGPFESVEQARTRLLVLLDEFSGLHAESCEIDYKLHNIVGGRKRNVVQTIQEETATNVYLASPFAGVLGAANHRPSGVASRQNTVYITGEFFGVQRAKEMLFQVSVHKSKCIISRDTMILPRKLDWLLLERLEELRNIMLDNGTFINLPVIGSQASLVSVYGDNRVSIERTIRCMMQLASQFYTASIYLLPLSYDVYNMSYPALNPSQMTPILKNISNLSGAEVVFKRDCFEVHGLESEVRTGVKLLLELEMVSGYNFQVHFHIELANEHREFISGKKNGKINKIMKQCNVRIKFETFNDYNFLIEISGNDRQGVLQGLSFLQEELPAEVSFHVPEAYHKRIIGVGGKNIQRIMKKYGVYVKFSNAEEFAALGGYLENEDNVIARTPAKNAINLENLKQAVMELITPKDKDYLTETIPVSRRYQRTLLGEKSIFIHDIENKTSSLVRFPPKELGSDLVSIFGPEAQIHIAAQMLLDHVPFEAEFRTPDSPALAQLVNTQEYVALTQRLKRDLNIHVLPPVRQPHTGEAAFRLRLNRSNTDFLPTAKDLIEDFLVSRNIGVYASEERARSDSFASSFPHFANKLISSVRHDSTDSLQADAARYNERRLRPAASTPDIKALFDSPAHIQRNYTTTNLNSPFVNSSIYSSPYAEGHSRVASVTSSDVWGAPSQSRHVPSSSSSSGMQIQFPQQGPPISQQSTGQPQQQLQHQQHHHHPRMSDDVNLLSKEGEPVSLGMEEKFKALRKPRSFAHRAQSLDIGAMAADQQATAAPRGIPALGSFTPPAGSSAPANVHSYPFTGSSHHGSSSSISRMAPGAAGMPNQATTDEVSRVLAQLAFDRN